MPPCAHSALFTLRDLVCDAPAAFSDTAFRRKEHNFSASDIFFSAITPSATGGQPAALILMMKSGIPAAVSAIALLLNLVMYTVAILLISAVCCLVHPGILLRMSLAPKLFIAFGVIVQLAFIALFLMCIFNDRLILSVCRWGLKLMCRLHIYKDYDVQYEKLLAMIKQYKKCGELLRRETGLLIKIFLCNLAQRLSVILVSVCVFLAVGGKAGDAFKAFSVQAFAVWARTPCRFPELSALLIISCSAALSSSCATP